MSKDTVSFSSVLNYIPFIYYVSSDNKQTQTSEPNDQGVPNVTHPHLSYDPSLSPHSPNDVDLPVPEDSQNNSSIRSIRNTSPEHVLEPRQSHRTLKVPTYLKDYVIKLP